MNNQLTSQDVFGMLAMIHSTILMKELFKLGAVSEKDYTIYIEGTFKITSNMYIDTFGKEDENG